MPVVPTEFPASARDRGECHAARRSHGCDEPHGRLRRCLLRGHALRAVELADISALRGERAAISLCEARVAALHSLLATQPKVSTSMNNALFALQRAADALGAAPGDWRTTEVTSSPGIFNRRLESLSVILKERSEAVSQQICRVEEPTVRSFAEAMDYIKDAK